ncbi:MAG: DEAD/DEAH box helicase, partial [Deltaproteobacteria bacterium]|nr:DEAD/DEAH box helicase [Deltaproteobacteria bacterium]
MTTESPQSSATSASGVTSFADLQFAPEIARALEDLGFAVPTPVQAQSIAPLRSGRDVVVRAQTGTGKTAAFGLPVL